MDYSINERLNVKVSRLGYGCMRFPILPDGTIDEPAASALLHRAYEAGVNYFDTARPYHDGASEAFLGRALADLPRDSYYLATKLPVWNVKCVADAQAVFDGQLKDLNTDYVDFYLLHALSAQRWEDVRSQGVHQWALKMKEQGKLRRLGFSFHGPYEAFAAILQDFPWDFCQIQYNYLDTDFQAGDKGYELATRLGIPVVVMEPVRGGMLASPPADVAELLHALDPAATPASWAIRWVAGHSNVLTVLSGMGSMAQVEDNLASLSPLVPLSPTEEKTIAQAAAAIRSKVKNGCTNCKYCMPCPAGVNIPGVFSVWNYMAKTTNTSAVARRWRLDVEADARPDKCVRCGACLAQCPQSIPIPDHLARALTDLSPLKE